MYNIFDASPVPPSLFLVLDSVVAPAAVIATGVVGGLHCLVVLAGGVGADPDVHLGLALLVLAVGSALETRRINSIKAYLFTFYLLGAGSGAFDLTLGWDLFSKGVFRFCKKKKKRKEGRKIIGPYYILPKLEIPYPEQEPKPTHDEVVVLS